MTDRVRFPLAVFRLRQRKQIPRVRRTGRHGFFPAHNEWRGQEWKSALTNSRRIGTQPALHVECRRGPGKGLGKTLLIDGNSAVAVSGSLAAGLPIIRQSCRGVGTVRLNWERVPPPGASLIVGRHLVVKKPNAGLVASGILV